MIALMTNSTCKQALCFQLVRFQIPVKSFQSDMERSCDQSEFTRDRKTAFVIRFLIPFLRNDFRVDNNKVFSIIMNAFSSTTGRTPRNQQLKQETA